MGLVAAGLSPDKRNRQLLSPCRGQQQQACRKPAAAATHIQLAHLPRPRIVSSYHRHHGSTAAQALPCPPTPRLSLLCASLGIAPSAASRVQQMANAVLAAPAAPASIQQLAHLLTATTSREVPALEAQLAAITVVQAAEYSTAGAAAVLAEVLLAKTVTPQMLLPQKQQPQQQKQQKQQTLGLKPQQKQPLLHAVLHQAMSSQNDAARSAAATHVLAAAATWLGPSCLRVPVHLRVGLLAALEEGTGFLLEGLQHDIPMNRTVAAQLLVRVSEQATHRLAQHAGSTLAQKILAALSTDQDSEVTDLLILAVRNLAGQLAGTLKAPDPAEPSPVNLDPLLSALTKRSNIHAAAALWTIAQADAGRELLAPEVGVLLQAAASRPAGIQSNRTGIASCAMSTVCSIAGGSPKCGKAVSDRVSALTAMLDRCSSREQQATSIAVCHTLLALLQTEAGQSVAIQRRYIEPLIQFVQRQDQQRVAVPQQQQQQHNSQHWAAPWLAASSRSTPAAAAMAALLDMAQKQPHRVAAALLGPRATNMQIMLQALASSDSSVADAAALTLLELSLIPQESAAQEPPTDAATCSDWSQQVLGAVVQQQHLSTLMHALQQGSSPAAQLVCRLCEDAALDMQLVQQLGALVLAMVHAHQEVALYAAKAVRTLAGREAGQQALLAMSPADLLPMVDAMIAAGGAGNASATMFLLTRTPAGYAAAGCQALLPHLGKLLGGCKQRTEAACRGSVLICALGAACDVAGGSSEGFQVLMQLLQDASQQQGPVDKQPQQPQQQAPAATNAEGQAAPQQEVDTPQLDTTQQQQQQQQQATPCRKPQQETASEANAEEENALQQEPPTVHTEQLNTLQQGQEQTAVAQQQATVAAACAVLQVMLIQGGNQASLKLGSDHASIEMLLQLLPPQGPQPEQQPGCQAASYCGAVAALPAQLQAVAEADQQLAAAVAATKALLGWKVSSDQPPCPQDAVNRVVDMLSGNGITVAAVLQALAQREPSALAQVLVAQPLHFEALVQAVFGSDAAVASDAAATLQHLTARSFSNHKAVLAVLADRHLEPVIACIKRLEPGSCAGLDCWHVIATELLTRMTAVPSAKAKLVNTGLGALLAVYAHYQPLTGVPEAATFTANAAAITANAAYVLHSLTYMTEDIEPALVEGVPQVLQYDDAPARNAMVENHDLSSVVKGMLARATYSYSCAAVLCNLSPTMAGKHKLLPYVQEFFQASQPEHDEFVVECAVDTVRHVIAVGEAGRDAVLKHVPCMLEVLKQQQQPMVVTSVCRMLRLLLGSPVGLEVLTKPEHLEPLMEQLVQQVLKQNAWAAKCIGYIAASASCSAVVPHVAKLLEAVQHSTQQQFPLPMTPTDLVTAVTMDNLGLLLASSSDQGLAAVLSHVVGVLAVMRRQYTPAEALQFVAQHNRNHPTVAAFHLVQDLMATESGRQVLLGRQFASTVVDALLQELVSPQGVAVPYAAAALEHATSVRAGREALAAPARMELLLTELAKCLATGSSAAAGQAAATTTAAITNLLMQMALGAAAANEAPVSGYVKQLVAATQQQPILVQLVTRCLAVLATYQAGQLELAPHMQALEVLTMGRSPTAPNPHRQAMNVGGAAGAVGAVPVETCQSIQDLLQAVHVVLAELKGALLKADLDAHDKAMHLAAAYSAYRTTRQKEDRAQAATAVMQHMLVFGNASVRQAELRQQLQAAMQCSSAQ